MSRPAASVLLVLVVAAGAAAQQPISDSTPGIPPGNSLQKSFRPSIVVVIGIFFFMFSITFALLIYSRFCNSPSWLLSPDANNQDDEAVEGRNSGIDKAVIESLPFFRFSALKGSREGLECAVCLSRFEDNEILRFLPRCKHAFHMDCIDRWLHSHSSCPLCRTRVDAEDLAFFKYSASSCCLHRDPSDRPAVSEPVDCPGEGALELYVEREQVGSPTGRFAASFRWLEKLKKGGESLLPRSVKDTAAATAVEALHNLKHRILVSQVVFRNRWSDFNSADLISLDSEMLREMSIRRLDLAVAEGGEAAVEKEAAAVEQGVSRIRVEMERKRRLESKVNRMGVSPTNINPEAGREVYSGEYAAGDRKALISPASRSFSDITTLSRYRPTGRRYGEKEERVRQMWLPIARRTVQWFAGKDSRPML